MYKNTEKGESFEVGKSHFGVYMASTWRLGKGKRYPRSLPLLARLFVDFH